jgi:hypothetical protein
MTGHLRSRKGVKNKWKGKTNRGSLYVLSTRGSRGIYRHYQRLSSANLSFFCWSIGVIMVACSISFFASSTLPPFSTPSLVWRAFWREDHLILQVSLPRFFNLSATRATWRKCQHWRRNAQHPSTLTRRIRNSSHWGISLRLNESLRICLRCVTTQSSSRAKGTQTAPKYLCYRSVSLSV